MASLAADFKSGGSSFARCGELACQKDSYLKSLTTVCVSCVPRAAAPAAVPSKGKKKGGGGEPNKNLFDVVLEDTVLFPEGGGQPSDVGTVGGVACVGVENRDGVAVHVLEAAVAPGQKVAVEVAWGKRWHNMSQHSCQHLVTALAVKLFGIETTSWNLGPEVSFLELGTADFCAEQVAELEAAANEGEGNRHAAGHAVRKGEPHATSYAARKGGSNLRRGSCRASIVARACICKY